jgi:hypothetical protein
MRLFDVFFGCRHAELSRVFTIGGQTYCVCWSCGSRFAYSLTRMRMGRRVVEMATVIPARSG